jgi:hypothetical protein
VNELNLAVGEAIAQGRAHPQQRRENIHRHVLKFFF